MQRNRISIGGPSLSARGGERMHIRKDNEGFEDIDDFWDIVQNTNAVNSRSNDRSYDTGSEDFNYEDSSGSITDDDNSLNSGDSGGESEMKEEYTDDQPLDKSIYLSPAVTVTSRGSKKSSRSSSSSPSSSSSSSSDLASIALTGTSGQKGPGRTSNVSSSGSKHSSSSSTLQESLPYEDDPSGTQYQDDNDDEDNDESVVTDNDPSGLQTINASALTMTMDTIKSDSVESSSATPQQSSTNSSMKTFGSAKSSSSRKSTTSSAPSSVQSSVKSSNTSNSISASTRNTSSSTNSGSGSKSKTSSSSASKSGSKKHTPGKTPRRVSFGPTRETEDVISPIGYNDGDEATYDNDDMGAMGGDFDEDSYDRDDSMREQEEEEQQQDQEQQQQQQQEEEEEEEQQQQQDQEEEEQDQEGEFASETTPRSSGRQSLRTPMTSSAKSTPRTTISTPGSNEFARGQRLARDDTYLNEDEEIDTDIEEDADTTLNTTLNGSSFVDQSFLHTISNKNAKYKGGYKRLVKNSNQVNQPKSQLLEDEDYDEDDSSGSPPDSEEEEEDATKMRRSRRATKGKRFAFWKGERPLYEHGTLVGLLNVDPTPKKVKKTSKRAGDAIKGAKAKRRRKVGSDDEEEGDDEDTKDQPITLPSGLHYLERSEVDSLDVWDDVSSVCGTRKVVCRAESLLPASALPKTAQRAPGRDKVGNAAHSFNVPEVPGEMSGWISGFVDLPPEAIKDAEGVGKYAQVFFVSSCQDNAVELGIADPAVDHWKNKTAQRLILRQGDSFFIPPGNIYRLENHSSTKPCMLFWTIIKPIEDKKALDTSSQASESSPIGKQ